ncbi:hypothetical protein [Catellatospora sp. NPDC049609]|uniref:hypothetical protein n=1 Tax=Catellatospora sp. NPDC049609 TaxID=3155505 RepID=UPI003428AE24
MSVVYLRDDPDRAPRLTPADLAPPDTVRELPAASRMEKGCGWALVVYAVVVAAGLLACAVGGAVWVWTAALS